MKRKMIYVAGPMTGIEGLNYEAFAAAAVKLRDKGWHVITPFYFNMALGYSDPKELDDRGVFMCMAAEKAILPFVDAIYLLKGWERSNGARLEVAEFLNNSHGQIIVERSEA